MRKEKVVCDFDKRPHEFNKIKRSSSIERAPRPKGGGHQGGKPVKGDVTPPGFTSITIGNVGESTASLSWVTNEETTCTVQYGLTTSYGSTKAAQIGVKTHSIILTGLTANTTYHFRIVATDLAGNVSNSIDYNFFTASVASNVIYIEFYGATISGTTWNTNGAIIAAHSGFTTLEVEEVLSRIQAHFADYNVVVTDDILVYNAAPTASKQRVIITESNEWYGSSAGGVAYINSWGWSDQSPAWVFSKLLSYSTHNVGEAAAHEIGHILGCRHQVTCANGVITSQYNWGDGITAPTMGASYNVPAGDWWVGPNSLGCSVIQDDNQIITGKLGLKP